MRGRSAVTAMAEPVVPIAERFAKPSWPEIGERVRLLWGRWDGRTGVYLGTIWIRGGFTSRRIAEVRLEARGRARSRIVTIWHSGLEVIGGDSDGSADLADAR